ncbi:MAG: porin [Chitinophagaceae bacterium]|nr:porin [Chitinophagaceae bacterium]
MMAGDYTKANLADEPAWARNFYEANLGFKLNKKEELWLDAGLLPSHIGMESAIGKDNRTATRGIIADNSPYYEAGIRLSYQPSKQWYLALLTLTGWQSITVPKGQKGETWGLQVTYTPSSVISFNSSSCMGDVLAGTKNVKRIYSDVFTTITFNKTSVLTLGWDIGLEESAITPNKTNIWNGLTALYQQQIKPGKWSATLRYEKFMDKNNTIIQLPLSSAYKINLSHTSLNVDGGPVKGLLMRAEANYQSNTRPVFYKSNSLVKNQLSAFFICSCNFRYSK